jgi:hypothetical protein
LRQQAGRVLSRYLVPSELTELEDQDDALWIITDDLAEADALTTVLWPSDY